MSAPNTERASFEAGFGGNESGTVLYGDQPGTTDKEPSDGVPDTAVVVTGTPGTVCLEVKGDLLVNGSTLLAVYTVATLPDPVVGGLIFVSDPSGSPVIGTIAFGNGDDWIDVLTGSPVV